MVREVLKLIKDIHHPVAKRMIDVRISGARSRSIQRGKKGKDDAFELSTEYIMNLYVFQRGKCYMTKRPLSLNPNDTEVLSLDRKDPIFSYRQFNTGLTTKTNNLAKGNMTSQEYIDFLEDTHNRVNNINT